MSRFLTDDDYAVQIRTEISKIIDSTTNSVKLIASEQMAIDQIKNHIAGRYDCDKIFTPADTTDTRDKFIVMIVIDLALYHLWTKEAPNNIPKTRELRYNDALEWLKEVQKGQSCNLPKLQDDSGVDMIDVRIWSDRTPENNMY